MKRSVLIKRAVFLAVLCVAAWQLPNILEQAMALKERFRGESAVRNTSVSLPTPPPKRAGERKMMVISPSGQELTPEEQERLRKAAEAAAPMRVGRARVEDPAARPEGEETPELDDAASQLDEMLEDAVQDEAESEEPKRRDR